MKIVLNVILAKLKGTGGFSVASNFFNKTLEDKENEWYYFVSHEFDEEVKGLQKGIDEQHYFVFHSQPNLRYYFSEKSKIRQTEEIIKPDIVYSILAPSYHRFKSNEVMRCANAWAVKGGVNKYAMKSIPLKLRIKYIIKAWITQLQMRNTKYFVTQSEIAKKCIMRTVKTSPENVCVVSNVLPEKYQRLGYEKIPHNGFNMIYVATPGLSKDNGILPHVAFILKKKYKLRDFKIHVTIPDDYKELYSQFVIEMKKYGVEDCFINHGRQKQEDLIKIYSLCDLGLFPSLLETFSVTTLEYMYFKLPIVASDLNFNKEVAGDAAIYFKPHNAEDFAEKINLVYRDKDLQKTLLMNATERLKYYSNNEDKFSETVRFLQSVVQKNNMNVLTKEQEFKL